MLFKNGDKYKGNFKNDKFNGKGELITKNSNYQGDFVNGVKEGQGV